jgi:hypothetical protein
MKIPIWKDCIRNRIKWKKLEEEEKKKNNNNSFNIKVKNEWSYTSTPLCVIKVWTGITLPFLRVDAK